MTKQVIPDTAVEAAAEAIAGGLLTKSIADLARAALEAAAPHMLAPVDIEDRENAAWWQARIDERNAGATK